MCLAYTYPELFHKMELLMSEKGVSVDQACLKVFQVRYRDFCNAVLTLYNLPEDVKRIISLKNSADSAIISIVKASNNLAAMLFGQRPGGKKVLKEAEKGIGKILGTADFSVPDLVRRTFKNDINVERFFSLSAEDVEMLVNILEWGKAVPMEVVGHISFGSALNASEIADPPEVLIGNFLTELVLCRKRHGDLNQVLMLAQEALFRCLLNSEIFIAFLNIKKQRIQGHSYVGTNLQMKARDFSVPIGDPGSLIVRCVRSGSPINLSHGSSGLGLPDKPFGKIPFQYVYMSPVIVKNRGVGLCFAGRMNGKGFNDRECVWVDQITEQIAAVFKSSGK